MNKKYIIFLIIVELITPLCSIWGNQSQIIRTKISTKTPISADYSPGIVTIMFGNDLEKTGVRNFGQALKLIPGVELTTDHTGIWQTMVRGVNRTFSYGNFKILINDIPLSKVFWINSVPNIPIEQIERIEVIRGPGAAMFGEFAMSGVVNLVTKERGLIRENINRVYSSFSSYNSYMGGASAYFSLTDYDFNFGMNVSGLKTDGSNIKTGPDKALILGNKSYAPGQTNEKMDFLSGIFTLQFNELFVQAYSFDHGQGDFFGFDHTLPPQNDYIVFRDRQWGIDAKQRINFSSSFYADFMLGFQTQLLKGDNIYLRGNPPDELFFNIYYKDSLLHGGVDFFWESNKKMASISQHKILVGYSFSKKEINQVWFESNFNPSISGIPLNKKIHLDGYEIGLNKGKYRLIHSITVQDILKLSRRFTLTGSLRFEKYNDLSDIILPRFAAVFRINKQNIIKAQYANAFRPPTFDEMYGKIAPIEGNPNLIPETIETYELGYIYRERDMDRVIRCTLFYSFLKDLILIDKGYKQNSGKSLLKGVELEFNQKLSKYLELNTNISYVNPEDRITYTKISESASIISNVSLKYEFPERLSLAFLYRYVSNRQRELWDIRNSLKNYNTLDFTATVLNLFGEIKGLNIRAGIKNLLNEDVRYPCLLGENNVVYYPEDFPGTSRSFWALISYNY